MMRFRSLRRHAGFFLLLPCVFWVGGCSRNGGGSGAAGISLPSEVSAVSARESDDATLGSARSARQALEALQDLRLSRAVSDLPADSDYNTAVVRKFVEIEVLDVFDIVEQIFQAFSQTNYSSPDNVNQGPYKCMVAWEENGEGGVTQTLLQTWVLDSSMLSIGGTTTNRVHAWIQETSPQGETELIRVQVDIQQAPAENEDGTLADLGIWEIKASFGDVSDGNNFFFADAAIMEDGTSRLRVQEQFMEEINGQEFSGGMKGVIFRDIDQGFGKVSYPNWSACFGPVPEDCSGGPPQVEVAFAYNENYLSVQVEGEAEVSFDRTDEHTIVHKYGVFSATDGSNIEREKEFGFPVSVEGGGFGWYGAWQDRHQLWVGGGSVEDGIVVTRQDVPPGQEAPSYTTESFNGALTMIRLSSGDLDQILGFPLEIHLFNNFMIRYDQAQARWEECLGNDGMGGCASMEDFTPKLDLLAASGEGDQRNIFINRCDMNGCSNYVYVTGPTPGFFEAAFNPDTGRWESNGTAYDPADGDQLWCSVGGRTYISYTADFDGPVTTSGWVEKSLLSFDPSTWTPTFDPDGDREFLFEVNREYFINNRGVNLRVTRIATNQDAADYQLFMEVQEVAKPSAGLSSVYESGTVLVEPWDPDAHSTYVLETDSADPGYLLLKVDTVSSQDATNGIVAGDVVTKDIWGLRIQGDASPLADATLYNWEYRDGPELHGGVTYLMDSGEYVLLDDPIRFEPVELPRTTDIVNGTPPEDWLSFSLMYDGNMHGFPDTWFELQKNNFEGGSIPQILANNAVIPDGTELVDQDGLHYYVKAIDAGIFLGFVTAFPNGPAPDMTLPDTIDLESDIPAFVAPDVDLEIPSADLKYIKGIPVPE